MMKKLLTVLFITMITQSISFAQNHNNISGTYVCNSGSFPWILHIDKNHFEILQLKDAFDPPIYTFFNDTIATGKVRYESKNLIKLSSDNMRDKVINSIVYNEYYDDRINDKIKIKFKFTKCDTFKFDIMCWYGTSDALFFSLIDGVDSLYIPAVKDHKKNYSSITFDISSSETSEPSSGFGSVRLSVMRIYYDYGLYGLPLKNPKNNVIEISIPALNNDVFSRFQIENEYAKINNNNQIIWKGKIFTRTSKEILNLETLKNEQKKYVIKFIVNERFR